MNALTATFSGYGSSTCSRKDFHGSVASLVLKLDALRGIEWSDSIVTALFSKDYACSSQA